jgi:hypothetical protein
MRVCSMPNCPALIPKAGRCVDHERIQQRARGTTTQRGYGSQHQKLRAEWKPVVESGRAICARCGQPILVGQPWDLGHNDNDRDKYNGPEHANTCNRSAAGRKSHQQ